MGTVIQARQLPPHRLVVALYLYARLFHGVDLRQVELQAAHEIQHHVNFHAGAGALDQGIGEFLADRARPVDIGFEGDGFFGRADRVQHGREDLVAIEQDLDFIPFEDGWAEQDPERAAELRVVGVVLAGQAGLDLRFARHEIEREYAADQRERGRDEDGPESFG